MRDIYVFIGAPGAGKGSLARILSTRMGWKQLSTGNLCRMHTENKTDIGKQIDFSLRRGILIPDGLVTMMVGCWILELPDEVSSVVLDGYPRTISQAEGLERIIKEHAQALKVRVIKFFISNENVIIRLSSRFVCGNKKCQLVYSVAGGELLAPRSAMTCDICASTLQRRVDDDPDVVRDRLKVYRHHEQDIVNFYLEAGRPVIEMNVEKPLETVFEEFKELMCLNDYN